MCHIRLSCWLPLIKTTGELSIENMISEEVKGEEEEQGDGDRMTEDTRVHAVNQVESLCVCCL